MGLSCKYANAVSGKTIGKFDASNPGPLGNTPDSLAGTFSGGRYTEIELDKSLTLHRAWSPSQREYGAFWSLEKPSGSLQSRIDSALLPEWGQVKGSPFRIQSTKYTTIEVPAGSTVYVGEVGSQGGAWVGGTSQALIKGGPKPAWKTGGGLLR